MLGKHAKYEIVEAIRRAEESTRGEIRVHVRNKSSPDPMKEARKVFRRLGMHRTTEHNGVLIFVALKSQTFVIFGDEAMHQKVGDLFWNATRDKMKGYFEKDDMVGGIIAGVQSVGEKLKQHFPAETGNKNELSDGVSEG